MVCTDVVVDDVLACRAGVVHASRYSETSQRADRGDAAITVEAEWGVVPAGSGQRHGML